MASESGNGLLVVWTDIPPEAEAEFNEWYNSEHIPQLVGIPGFLSGKRYVAVDGKPKYTAIYELKDENVMKSDAFLQVRENPTPWSKKMIPLFRDTQIAVFKKIFTYGERPPKNAEFSLTVRLNTPADHEKDFNTWYNEDHIPALVGVPGVYCASRYVAVEGDPKYLAVYEMRDGSIPSTPEWNKARNFGRTAEIRQHLKDLQGIVGRRIYPL